MKVINPCKKGDYEVHKLHVNKQYFTVLELKKQLVDSLKNHIPNNMDFHVGYIEPGKQGIRGKMRWIFTEEDLADMYSIYRGKSEILLWCDGQSPEKGTEMSRAKHANPGLDNSSESTIPKKSHTCTTLQSKKISDVQVIYEELDGKHHGKYTPEQLRTWAHLIQMDRHASYEEPPNKPFFRGIKSSKSGEQVSKKANSNPCQSQSSDNQVGLSPLRRANLRSAYMGQMKEWHGLLEAGAITSEEYDEHKHKILGDLGKL